MFAVLTVVGLPTPPVIDLAQALHVSSNMAGTGAQRHEELRDRPRVRVTANGIGSALPDVSFTFGIVFNCCVGAVSAYPKQEFSAVPDTDDPEDAQLESSCEGKRGTLKANTFGCNLF